MRYRGSRTTETRPRLNSSFIRSPTWYENISSEESTINGKMWLHEKKSKNSSTKRELLICDKSFVFSKLFLIISILRMSQVFHFLTLLFYEYPEKNTLEE